MTRIGKFWTDSVAYVALVTGAAVSIAGNVVDTQRSRGDLMDSLDVVMAALFPALVVLMVEVFVSSRWNGLRWPMQALRWAGCAGITFVAMRISWVHLNDLMLSRGQKEDVAILGPLAIDFLAIMATALILAGRGQGAMPEPIDLDQVMDRWDIADWDSTELEQWAAEADAPVSPAPVSAPPAGTAEIVRKPRAAWDARRVCELAMDGVKAGDARNLTGVAASTYGRYLRVSRILKEDPRAVIAPSEKVSAEHVSILRELASK